MAKKIQKKAEATTVDRPYTNVTRKMDKGTSWCAEVKTTGQSFKVEVNSISGLFKRCENFAS